MLIFTPQWIPTQPSLGLPSLTAFLRSHGHEVIQRDINAECYDILLSKEYVLNIQERLSQLFRELDAKPQLTPEEQKDFETLFIMKSLAPVVANRMEDAKRVYRSEDFYDIDKLAESRMAIRDAFSLISRAYSPTIIDLSWYEMGRLEESLAGLEKATTEREINPFIEIYENHLLSSILREQPDLIGLSIISTNQLVPGLTLARMIKARDPGIHIVVGGSVITQLADKLSSLGVLFRDYFDSYVVYEGEQPLLELVERLGSHESLDGVQNLVYHDGERIRINDVLPPVDIDSLPTPDYDGLPLDLYLTPEPVLSLLSSRGCYWGKCAFCFHGIVYHGLYRLRNSIKVVDDIERLQKKYGSTNFAFSDEAISPRGFEEISDEIIRRGLRVRTLADARIDRKLTESLCLKMAHAGFKTLYFGMESGCQRVLDHMVKGIEKDAIVEISRNVTKAGMWSHMFAFFGFPTETREEAQETVDFLFAHKEIISSFSITYFQLGKDSPAATHPEKFGITKVHRDPNREMQFMYRYEAPAGISQNGAMDLCAFYMDKIIREFPTGNVIQNLGYDNLLLYLTYFEKKDPYLKSIQFYPGITRKEEPKGRVQDISLGSMPVLKEGLKVQALGYNIIDIQRRIRNEERAVVLPHPTSVLYHPGTGRILSVSPSGKRILDHCSGTSTIRSIAGDLARHYGMPQQKLESDCLDFFRSLMKEGVIILSNPALTLESNDSSEYIV